MNGLFAAFGPIIGRLSRSKSMECWSAPPLAGQSTAIEKEDAWIMVSRSPQAWLPNIAASDDGTVTLVLDGYLTTDLLPHGGLPEIHLQQFANHVALDGLDGAMKHLRLASFSMLVLDERRAEYHALTDPLCLLPLYYMRGDEGLVVSTRAHFIAEIGLAGTEPDWTAMAEWIYYNAPFGARTPLKSIQFLQPGERLVYDRRTHRASCLQTSHNVLRTPYSQHVPDLNELYGRFRDSCERHYSLGGRVAQFQSGGFDSRFILASWPGAAPPCYTYGPSDSVETQIARRVADLRQSAFHQFEISGEDFVSGFDALFRLNGGGAFITRLIAARNAYENGQNAVLDGIFGDVLLGGLFYTALPERTLLARTLSLAGHFRDNDISHCSPDELAQWVFDQMRVCRKLGAFCEEGFIQKIKAAEQGVLHDIAQQIRAQGPVSSAARLLREFKIRNRTIRYVNQQAMATRSYLSVLSPFAADLDFVKMAIALPPDRVVYNKLYISLYRQFCRSFGDIPTDHSLLSLNRHPAAHRIFETLTTKLKLRNSYSRIRLHSQPVPESGLGLFESSAVYRDFAARELTRAGIVSSARMQDTIRRFNAGEKLSSGVVQQLIAIGRWLDAPSPVSAQTAVEQNRSDPA